MSEAELASAARPILDAHYTSQITAFHDRFEQLSNSNLATNDVSDAARAATFGAINTLLVDIDTVVNGVIDEETGAVTLDAHGDANNYGVVNEIAGRAFRSGARVLGVRRTDIPGGKDLAAILRYRV